LATANMSVELSKIIIGIEQSLDTNRQQVAFFEKTCAKIGGKDGDDTAKYVASIKERIASDEAWLVHFKAKLKG
jgi:hypothetical protein